MSASTSSASTSYETVFTNSKAGMDGVDKQHVQKVVYEMSKNSAYFHEEQRRDAAVAVKVAELKRRAERVQDDFLKRCQARADAALADVDRARNLDRVWACIDMDAFFASCEALEDPSLQGNVPFAVGGPSMITTASYEARKYGVRSAMPGFIGARLCRERGVTLRFVNFVEVTSTPFRDLT